MTMTLVVYLPRLIKYLSLFFSLCIYSRELERKGDIEYRERKKVVMIIIIIINKESNLILGI